MFLCLLAELLSKERLPAGAAFSTNLRQMEDGGPTRALLPNVALGFAHQQRRFCRITLPVLFEITPRAPAPHEPRTYRNI